MSTHPAPSPRPGIIGSGAYLHPVQHPAGPSTASPVLLALAVLLLALAIASPILRSRAPHAWWYLIGFPLTCVRMRVTWRRLTTLTDLAVPKRPDRRILGDVEVRGRALRPIPPTLGLPRPRRGGLVVTVRLHPGQTPEQYAAVADALAHAWRVHAVRVTSPGRGLVELSALGWDPLTETRPPHATGRLLAATVGNREDGRAWMLDLRAMPHWLIVGATQSGKSTLLAGAVSQWARQAVALVGIDLKGGMELSLFQARLSALATTRSEAAGLLAHLVQTAMERMATCRAHGARSIWELPGKLRPVPIIVLIDELAELFLMATRDERDEVARTSTALIRLAQLGAALGIHLVIAGQRVGSDLGPGATALRAQLAGRICHRVNDPGTAEMALGDLNKDALAAAQQITEEEKGVAITFEEGGGWMRTRSTLTTPERARAIAQKYAHLTPALGDLGPNDHPGVYA
ncbi:FtsK/SpoIIIE domain-containing protein [Phaeacidiphilus oryzae]|uniref:FtsK/SpoIIIE domain-containing protein n=1 Tax=Phaeacidiphilus oryzae TaxID=348818 RepID=UPI000ADBCC5B|nr:FtsK/SpoIIIE domain-containing protein [Phaeacidiphilus oryzae]